MAALPSAPATLTSWDAELKEFYDDDANAKLIHDESRALDWVEKKTDWDGDDWVIPMMYGRGDGFSSTFLDAQEGKAPTDHERFKIETRDMYGLADVQNKLIRQAVNKTGSAMPALKTEIDAKRRGLVQEMEQGLFSDGSGFRGLVVSKGVNTVVVDKIAMRHCNRYAKIQFGNGATNALAATDSAGNIVYTVVARNSSTRTLTLDADPTADTDVVADSKIFRKGDQNLRPYGFNDFLLDPITDPAAYALIIAAPFNGMDRSKDPTRLGGNFYNGVSDTVEDALINSGEVMADENVMPDICFVNTKRIVELDRLIESGGKYRTRFTKASGQNIAELGWDGVILHTAAGTVPVVAAPSCGVNDFYMLHRASWCLRSAGAAPGFLSEGSLDQGILRNSGSDSIEARLGAYLNLGCRAPGNNLRGIFAP